MNKTGGQRTGLFFSKLFLTLLGCCLIAISIFLWKSQESRNLSQLYLQAESAARTYSSETETRYTRINNALNKLANSGAPDAAREADEWGEDAAFFIESFQGIKSIAWVDKNFFIRLIAPLQDNEIYLNQKANAPVLGPADVNQMTPVYRGTELEGFVLGIISIDAFMSPVISGIKNEYMLQLTSEGETLFTSENWTLPQEGYVFKETINLQNTAVLNMSFAPTDEYLNSEIADAKKTLLFSLSFSLITIIAVYFAQNYNELFKLNVKRYRNLFEASQDAIFIINLAGEYQDANPAATKMVGYSLAELKQMTVDDLQNQSEALSSDTYSDVWTEVGSQITSLRHKEGQIIPVDLVTSPIREGQVQKYVLGIARDITERKQAQMALAKHVADLAKSNAELEKFAYVASHDLQEPLRMVASYVQLLARRYQGQLDADADKFIAFAVDGAKRMQILINDLLIYSRVGTQGKAFAATSCEAVLNNVLTDLQFAIAESEAAVTHDPLPTVMADAGQLAQLWQNLLGNAIKFRSEAAPEIHIGAERQDGTWQFSVRDNGIGMEPQYFDRIFTIFQRLHSMEEYTGTGIGLAVCKKIVERHNGRIWVESEPGQGSTFYFTLPIDHEPQSALPNRALIEGKRQL